MTEEKDAKPARKFGLVPGCLTIGLVIVIIGVIASGGDDKKAATAQSSAPAGPAVKVTAAEIFNAYQKNEAAAQQSYGGKTLEISGTIASIDLGLGDEPYVTLRTPNEFMSLQAHLTEPAQAKAAQLQKGQKITLTCTDISEIAGTPLAKDCSF